MAERKRMIIGVLYPEKLTFDGNSFQTGRLNKGARLICRLNKKLDENKNRQRESISALSIPVTPSGLLIDVDYQLFVKIVDHFVDLEPKSWAILTVFYSGEFDFTKIKER